MVAIPLARGGRKRKNVEGPTVAAEWPTVTLFKPLKAAIPCPWGEEVQGGYRTRAGALQSSREEAHHEQSKKRKRRPL